MGDERAGEWMNGPMARLRDIRLVHPWTDSTSRIPVHLDSSEDDSENRDLQRSYSIGRMRGILSPWTIEPEHEKRRLVSEEPSLKRIHGVGEIFAAALRARGLDTITAVGQAADTELMAIDGIGPVRAAQIRDSAQQLVEKIEPDEDDRV